MESQEKAYERLKQNWRDMHRRCSNPKRADYERYGGRGITVCKEWSSFEVFLSDMGYPPEGRTLDRIDGSLGYSKANCRWATKEQQDWNRGLYASNTSGIVGVRFRVKDNAWHATGMRKGRTYSLYFGPSKELAIQARQEWVDHIIQEIGA